MSRAAHPFLLAAPPDAAFPPAELALAEPDGLLAVGGDLTPVEVRQGIITNKARFALSH